MVWDDHAASVAGGVEVEVEVEEDPDAVDDVDAGAVLVEEAAPLVDVADGAFDVVESGMLVEGTT